MPGSSESGAVPSTTLIVPLLLGAEVVVPEPEPDLDDELDELPHALSATTATAESNTASTVRLHLLKTAPPP
jgi:hypothetical protein